MTEHSVVWVGQVALVAKLVVRRPFLTRLFTPALWPLVSLVPQRLLYKGVLDKESVREPGAPYLYNRCLKKFLVQKAVMPVVAVQRTVASPLAVPVYGVY